uniref:Uncharacterized protein n=1 Tax=mine drainage metagenome TaxID=410659 RepID=E6QLJ4_9ZZZZ
MNFRLTLKNYTSCNFVQRNFLRDIHGIKLHISISCYIVSYCKDFNVAALLFLDITTVYDPIVACPNSEDTSGVRLHMTNTILRTRRDGGISSTVALH